MGVSFSLYYLQEEREVYGNYYYREVLIAACRERMGVVYYSNFGYGCVNEGEYTAFIDDPFRCSGRRLRALRKPSRVRSLQTYLLILRATDMAGNRGIECSIRLVEVFRKNSCLLTLAEIQRAECKVTQRRRSVAAEGCIYPLRMKGILSFVPVHLCGILIFLAIMVEADTRVQASKFPIN